MKPFILLLVLFYTALALPALAGPGNYGSYKGAEYVRNYDGDTITFNLPWVHQIIGNEIGIRVNGIDAPEIRGKCKLEKERAYRAKEAVGALLANAENIDLLNLKRGKYFRVVADVVADGTSVKDFLIKNNLAVEYDGGRKNRDWCNHDQIY